MKRLSAFIVTLIFSLNVFVSAQEIYQSDKLEKLWETNGFSVPESVLPLAGEDILYVSNVGSNNSSEKEGKGFISIINAKGKILNLKWVTGLNSPKGMAVVGDKLYVSEVDRITEIDRKAGQKLTSYPVENAIFLNDIAADDKGNLYISDSRTGTVYKLHEGEISVFVRSEDFTGPNGVVVEGNYLYLGTGTRIVKIDLNTAEVKDFMLNTGGVDGLALLAPDRVIFSDWPGRVYLMKSGGEKELILDTKGSETFKTADFGFIKEDNIVLIPTFFANSIVAYKLKM